MKLAFMAAVALSAIMAGAACAGDVNVVDASAARKVISADAAGKHYKIATVVKVDGIAWFERMIDGNKRATDA